MIHKLSAFLLVVGLAFQTTAFAAPTPAPDAKRGELTPELKQNVLKLLAAVAREAQQFNLPENRVGAQTIIAGLMWEHDEQAARRDSQNAFIELQNLFGQIDAAQVEEMKSDERVKHYYKRSSLAKLRREYVLMLAARDAQAAIAALDALQAKKTEGYDPLEADELRLQLGSAIAKKDPTRAYALAKEQIAGTGIPYQFVEALKDLHGKNSELAAKLGKDVLAKIKSSKIRTPSAPVEESDEPAAKTDDGSGQTEIDFWQAASFISAASQMNRAAARDKEKKMQPLLTDAEMKESVDLIAGAYLTARNPAQYSISHLMAEIARYSPAQAQRIRLKVGARIAREFDRIGESSNYYYTHKEKSASELARDADRAAPDVRDQRYVDAISKAVEENEPEKAQAIFARIKDQKNYGYVLEQIEAALPLAKARRGDMEEVRKMLAGLKTNQERIAALTELASALAAKGEKETAKKLLDEALQMQFAIPFNRTGLESAGKIAAVYASIAPGEAFTIVETGIGQMNELINAGIALDKFYDSGSVERDELIYEQMSRQLLLHIPNSIDLLKNLACADFERAVHLADKFERSEIRLLVRLRIVQSLLDREASEKEKKMREKVETGDREH